MADRQRRPGEFELIDRYFRPLATDPGAFGLVDDTAVFAPAAGDEVVLKTDLVAEGVHFFADDPPASIARKALRVNLSDLASKGAEPVGYLVAIALRSDWTEGWVADFASGLAADQKRYGISLFGGDTSRAAGGATVTITAFGRAPAGSLVHRWGAKPGDRVYLSGTVGDAALGLRLRLGTLPATLAGKGARHLRQRYLHPEPRVALAAAVRAFASSSLDVSDGLVGDFGHICRASRVHGEIDASRVPLSPGARALVAADPSALETVLTGGDDYEILATVPEANAAAFEAAARRAKVAVTPIGRIARGRASVSVVDGAGRPLALHRRSFDHFKGQG